VPTLGFMYFLNACFSYIRHYETRIWWWSYNQAVGLASPDHCT